ncbi:hypothetical protein FSP39_011951 [Pinctada imbricata]|uniref:Uncharacterized protein n=1 Tax=Pinctada imbricata TaxID=66713 RepID=A0AA88YQB9_PINIB|nr:hypothetical protein FSP39_011951 [Pinctada imbricata]
MYHNRRVGGILLLQSYCASVLLFAGIYTVTRRLKIMDPQARSFHLFSFIDTVM